MKLILKGIYLTTLAISSLSFAACNNNGAPPAKFTIGGRVVNLVGTAGGLVLQDNLQNNLTVNSNGTFNFAASVPSGTALQHDHRLRNHRTPAQTCGVINGSGTATANITNIQVNCGHNEWAWANGPNTVKRNRVCTAPSGDACRRPTTPARGTTPATWTDASGNLLALRWHTFMGINTYSLSE